MKRKSTEIREFEGSSIAEVSDLAKLVFFGDEMIELDESILSALCNECQQLGYCKENVTLS